MTQFDDLFAASAVPLLQAEFGEPIVYLPLNRKPRHIMAIRVHRNPPEKMGEVRETLAPRLEIEVANDGTTGIYSGEINTGGDSVEVALRKGATDQVFGPKPWRIIALLSDYNGITRFEVQ